MALIETSNVVNEARINATFYKATDFVANDFAGQCAVGSEGKNTANGELWICTATNGTTTSTWVQVGLQA